MNFRGMSVHPFGFHASTFNYTDSQLLPFPGYSYSVLVSTNGSCCTSKPDAIIIPEAPLSGVSPPDLQAIGASQINVSWSPPSMQKWLNICLDVTVRSTRLGRACPFWFSTCSLLLNSVSPLWPAQLEDALLVGLHLLGRWRPCQRTWTPQYCKSQAQKRETHMTRSEVMSVGEMEPLCIRGWQLATIILPLPQV